MNDENLNIEEILLDNGYEGIKYLTDYSYDTAVIGVTNDGRVVYDFDLMVEWLIDKEGFSETDAVEWIDYNTIRALPYMGGDAPLILYKLIL